MGSAQQDIRERPVRGVGRLGRGVRRAVAVPCAALRTRGPTGRPASSGLRFDDVTSTGPTRRLASRPRSERTVFDVVADGTTTTVDVARRLWDAQSRSPLGGAASTSLRLAWIAAVSFATFAVLGFGLPRSLSGLSVVIVGLLLVIRPILLLCLGDDTLFTPDPPTRVAASSSARAARRPTRPDDA
jgi:hypothetical protein